MTASQVQHPVRAVVRTVFAAVVSFAGIFPAIVNAGHLSEVAGVSIAVAAAGGITRVLALPQVETFLQAFLPWLSAAPADQVASDVEVPEEPADDAPATPSGTSTPDTTEQ